MVESNANELFSNLTNSLQDDFKFLSFLSEVYTREMSEMADLTTSKFAKAFSIQDKNEGR